jgi:ABC-type uncharacterized transport system ATPase subunit
MAHAEELCQHIVMIHQGRKVLDEPMAGLRRQYDPRVIRFEPLDAAANLASLRRVPGVEAVDPTDEGCDVRLVEGRDPADAMRQLAAAIAPARIELARIRLEDVFIRLVTDGRHADDAEKALRANLQGLGAEGVAV